MLFDRRKKKKDIKTEVLSIEGRYCVFHHGLGVFTHDCGTLLCNECICESGICPNCGKPIHEAKPEPRPETEVQPDSAPREQATAKGRGSRKRRSAAVVMLNPAGAAGSMNSTDEERTIDESGGGKRYDTRATTEKTVREKSSLRVVKSAVPNDTSSAVRHASADSNATVPVRRHPTKNEDYEEDNEIKENEEGEEHEVDVEDDRDYDTDIDRVESEGENEETSPEIYDDDSLVKQPGKKIHVPKYKRRKHANLRDGSEDRNETDEEKEQEEKKWPVRTVPPIKKRDYESL